MIYHGNASVGEVILHTSATRGGWHKGKTADEMKCAMRSRAGMSGRGEATLDITASLRQTAQLQWAGRFTKCGAHVKGHNTGTLGICMVPVKTHAGITRFDDYFTEAQRYAVKTYIA